jgi:hypothetical protein
MLQEMKIWRISILCGAICSILVILLIAYQIVINNNIISMKSDGQKQLMVAYVSIFLFSFVTTLIAFPCFLYKSIPFFLMNNWLYKDRRLFLYENRFDFYSLLICGFNIGVLVILGNHIKYFT